MYESFFSYNVTKPYPYRWFSWTVFLGGLALTALLSVINVAADGYDISVQYMLNPNETEHPNPLPWFQKRPWSLASRNMPSCQDQSFLVGTMYTAYTITNLDMVWTRRDQPSDFDFNSFQVNAQDQPGLYWAAKLTAWMSTVGSNYSSATGDWQFHAPNTLSSVNVFVDGSELVSTYNDADVSVPAWSSRFGSDILTWYFSDSLDSGLDSLFGHQAFAGRAPNFSDPIQRVFVGLESSAKLLYSLILTDLGQSEGGNIFSGPDGVYHYLNATKAFAKESWSLSDPLWKKMLSESDAGYVPDNRAYQHPLMLFENAGTPVPKVQAAVINTEYLCQIPKLKPAGSLIVSVIVADLVLLNTIWVILNFVTKLFAERQDPTANHCSGCATSVSNDEKLDRAASFSSTEYHRGSTDSATISPFTPTAPPVVHRHPVEDPPPQERSWTADRLLEEREE